MTYFNPATLSRDLMAPASVSGFPQRTYDNLDYVHEELERVFWCFLRPQGRPSFTEPLLNDLHDVQQYITLLASRRNGQDTTSLGWVVLGSRTPNIFSLGGDLTVFSRLIRAGDCEGLRKYAYSCVEISYRNASGYGGDAISVGLAQGDALGGGFESLLSCDVLVAERRARFGLPEVLMNLFPGMGAHAFLTRRLGSGPAMKMILSGEVFSAQAMYDMGIVDVLADDGNGEAAVRDYIQRNESRHHAHAAIFRARRRVSPVSLQELRDVTDIWVETAMALTDRDLRRIQHLVSAQDRSRKVQPQGLMIAAE